MLYFSYSMIHLTKRLDTVICWLFYLLFFLAPLVFTWINHELFEYNKMMFVYTITVLVGGLFLAKAAIVGKLAIKRTPVDLFILAFLVANILSTVFSIDPHVSIWGYYSRFHQGLLATFSYIILFYVLVSTVKAAGEAFRINFVKRLLLFSFLGAFVCSIIAIMEHFGKDPLCFFINRQFDVSCWVQDVANRVYATMGQPNWLAAYLLILLPVVIFIFLSKIKKGGWGAIIFGALGIVFYLALIFTKSRSGFLAFWAIFVLGFLVTVFSSRKKDLIKGLFILFIIFFTLTLIYKTPFEKINQKMDIFTSNKKAQEEIVEKDDKDGPINISESGDIRKIVWGGAIDIFLAYPVFGSGVETFAYSYYKFKPIEHNTLSEWDFIYNKAHNEYLNYLATTGIIGFISYLAMILAFIVVSGRYIYRALINDGFSSDRSFLGLGLFFGWVSILITNFFGFSVVVVGLYFFLIPALLLLH